MNDWRTTWGSALRSVDDAAGLVAPGDVLAIPYSNGQPPALIRALVAQKERLVPPVDVYTGAASLGVFDYAEPDAHPYFHVRLLHPGRLRQAVAAGRAEYIPVDTMEFCRLLDEGIVPVDTAFVHVTPPDEDGFCSLGLTGGIAQAIVRRARRVIAQVNPNMPETCGESRVHASRFAAMAEAATPLIEWSGVKTAPSDIDRAIAANVARLVSDGATLQVGIGSLADAVLQAVSGKRRLRVLSGLVSDAVERLANEGALDAADEGALQTTAVIGSHGLYAWCHRNPTVRVLSTETLHRATVDAPRFTAINSALDVDLTGQVNVEALGSRIVGGAGGHLRFMLAASESRGGRAILALPSTSRDGRISRIKARLQDAPIATPRSCVHFVVTEHGIADLQGKSLDERAEAVSAVADPRFRSDLRREAADWPDMRGPS